MRRPPPPLDRSRGVAIPGDIVVQVSPAAACETYARHYTTSILSRQSGCFRLTGRSDKREPSTALVGSLPRFPGWLPGRLVVGSTVLEPTLESRHFASGLEQKFDLFMTRFDTNLQ